jgi:transposase
MKETILIKGRKGQSGRKKYSDSFKRAVAKQYLDGDLSLNQVGAKYGITKSHVSQWAKQFSGELAEETMIAPMTEQEQKDMQALQKQNETLKKKLEYEQMKNFALETMVDLAKSELGIDLRKNSGAKQPKK